MKTEKPRIPDRGHVSAETRRLNPSLYPAIAPESTATVPLAVESTKDSGKQHKPEQRPSSSKQLSFFIPCLIPTATSQQKGAFAMPGGGVRFFKKKKVKEAERTFTALLRPYAPPEPFTGPLCFVLTLTFPWRKSEKKSRIKAFGTYPIETRPDCSNLIKEIEDVMTTLRFWNDDSQISTLRISKRYGDRPGMTINLTSDLATDKEGTTTSL